MATSDANRASLAYQDETDWGTPNASPALKALRFKSNSFMHDKTTVVSDEIRSDRQVSDLAEVGSSASGSFAFELSYTEYQALIEAALFTTLSTTTFTGSADLSLSAQTIVAAAASFTNCLPGASVRVGGAANTLSNGIKRIVAVSVDGSTLTLAAGSIAANQTGAALTVRGKHGANGQTQRSFTIEQGLPDTLGGEHFQRFTGMTLDTFDLSVEPKKIITGNFGFVGKVGATSSLSLMNSTGTAATGTLTLAGNAIAAETVTIGAKVYTFRASVGATANEVLIGASATASIANLAAAINGGAGSGTTYGSATVASAQVTAVAGASTLAITAAAVGVAGNALATTDTMTNGSFGAATLTGGIAATANIASSTDPVMNGTTNVGNLTRDGLALSDHFKSVTIAVKNNLRGKDAIGTAGNFEIGSGRFEVTGALNAYFESNELLAAFIAHEYSSFGFTVTDGDGNTIAINLPRINFSKGNPAVTGINTDVMQSLDYQAILDTATGATMIVSFIPA